MEASLTDYYEHRQNQLMKHIREDALKICRNCLHLTFECDGEDIYPYCRSEGGEVFHETECPIVREMFRAELFRQSVPPKCHNCQDLCWEYEYSHDGSGSIDIWCEDSHSPSPQCYLAQWHLMREGPPWDEERNVAAAIKIKIAASHR